MIMGNGWVFVHVPKTGGNSMARALGGHDKDIAPHAPLFVVEKGNRFAFGFVRDPWERIASFYRFLCQKNFRTEYAGEKVHDLKGIRSMGFKSWLMDNEYHMWRDRQWRKEYPDLFPPMQRRPQMTWLKGCDFIGRYEHIERDWKKACKMAGIDVPDLPHINATTGGDSKKMHDADTIAFVAKHFAEDIETFGYRPPA